MGSGQLATLERSRRTTNQHIVTVEEKSKIASSITMETPEGGLLRAVK
jgi:hypothetical protein